MPREDRAETTRRERRWNPGPLDRLNLKLAIDETKLDRERFHYRWAKDTADRVRSLTAYDYDIAPEGAKSDTNSLGTVDSTLGGVDAGKPYNMVFMRKEREWFDTDQARKMKPLDEMDEAIRRGNGISTNPQAKEGFYTPGQNEIHKV